METFRTAIQVAYRHHSESTFIFNVNYDSFRAVGAKRTKSPPYAVPNLKRCGTITRFAAPIIALRFAPKIQTSAAHAAGELPIAIGSRHFKPPRATKLVSMS